MKTIFFGSATFVIPIIEMLHTHFNLALVVTTEKNANDSVPSFCIKNAIPYLSVSSFSECMIRLKEEAADVGVLASFGLLVPEEALNLFPKGILNIHPSLLPLYRGPTPVQSALLAGDNETGVSIIKLDKELDHGPLLAQELSEVLPTETTASLHDKLFMQGAAMLKNLLPDYLADNVELKEQNHNKATYTTNALTKQDGFINLAKPPDTKTLHQMIQAYYPWPTVWTKMTINGKEKIVKLLPENKLQVEGKKPMSLKDFINGYGKDSKSIEKLFV